VTPQAAASRYARALFDVARAEGLDVAALARELSGFAALVASHDALQRALVNPAIPAGRKRAVIQELAGRLPLAPVLARLLLLLAERDRLILLPDLVRAYESRLMDHQQVVRAEVTTAIPLPSDRVAALQQGLAAATGRQVQLDVRVDPEIVGGAVARIGSTVYDGSVVMQLERLKQRLVEADV
jgi:F-type H+-transporting ATPase subunit delta